MLINLYILSLVLGAILLVASLFLSGDRVESDDATPVQSDATRADQLGQLDGVAGGGFVKRTVHSRRFWTFFVSFFGMTGLVLDGLDVTSAMVALIAALGIGAVAGAGASAAVRIGSS